MNPRMIFLLVLLAAGCSGDPLPADSGPLVDAEMADSGVETDGGSPCRTDAQCDDGLFCNGVEVCTDGACAAGEAFDCDDGVACTTDSCSEATRACSNEPPDEDGDGVSDAACLGLDGLPLGRDCDDTDATRYPDNPEVCDAEGHDEDCDEATFGYRDIDMDGYPDAQCCNATSDGGQVCGNDCNDTVGGDHPATQEVCDGADNDCDGNIDEGVLRTFYVDTDGDLYGDATQPAVEACFAPSGYAELSGDCNDSTSAANPGAPEVCDEAMLDEDCNGTSNPAALCTCSGSETDSCELPGACSAGVRRCSDGFYGACSISPVAESCNGIDDDCDSVTDEGLLVGCFDDPDDDGYAASGAAMSTLCPTGGRAAVGGCPIGFTNRQPLAPSLDCDEGSDSTHPGAAETCNGIDDDCDGTADEGLPLRIRFIDSDMDGAEGTPVERCEGDPNSVPFSLDCNEADEDVHVGALELCDRIDNNCSLGGAAAGGVDVFEDEDDDGYAPVGATCTGGPLPATDCDDHRPTDNRGAAETCSGFDTDCDGIVDEDPEAFDSCTADNASAGCAMDGACAVFACEYGFADCNGDYADGCEVDLSADSESCGGCGYTCGAEAPCGSGLCDRIVAVSAGDNHQCLRFATGAMSCAGSNERGKLGDGTGTARTTHVAVVGLSGAVDSDAGLRHTCAALDDGGVSCWGENLYGQLGTGSRSLNSQTPRSVVDLSDSAVQVAVGRLFSCARLAGGEVQCWGLNGAGQLGDGVDTHSDCLGTDCAVGAVTVSGIADAVDVDADGSTACAVLSGGEVHCWGDGSSGKLGDGTSDDSSTPLAVPGVTTAVQVAVSSAHVCARLNDDTVTCWGRADRLGSSGSGSTATTATAVAGLSEVSRLETSDEATCVVYGAAGQVACWGENDGDQIGTTGATGANVGVATDMSGLEGATGLAMGGEFGCALVGQHMRCWGQNGNGQFGAGSTVSSGAPAEVPGLMLAADVGLYGNFACGRSTSGTLACWGSNGNGELAQGTTGGTSLVALEVPSLVAVAFDADSNTGCAVEPAGTVKCWGVVYDEAAGSSVSTPTPTPLYELDGVTEVSGVIAVRASRRNMCFLRDDGTLWCMGHGDFGTLGHGSQTSSNAYPVQVVGLDDVRAFDVDDSHACAVEGDGNAYCWGSDFLGALGRENSSGSGRFSTIQHVQFYDDIVDVRVAGQITCVRRATDELSCWGGLLEGQTYDPVPVEGLPSGDTTVFDAEGDSICVRVEVAPPTPSEPILCWNSSNVSGEMGNGTQEPVEVPNQVLDFADFDAVSAGTSATCAVRDSRRAIACWGSGTVLGDGSGVTSTRPVTVLDFP